MRARRRVLTAIGGAVLMASTLAAARQVTTGTVATPSPAKAAAIEAYGRLPVSFEQNLGQVDPQVRYLARTGAGTLFLTATDAVLAGPDGALRLRLDGANPAPGVAAEEPQAWSTNYLRHADPARGQTDVASFARVRYRDVYAGIDQLWHGTRHALEYDFVVQPGADPSAIALVPDGATATRLEPGGDLVMSVGNTEVRHRRPQVYQDLEAGRRAVEGAFVLRPGGRVGFALGPYDQAAPLVIDPLVYSTYLGGAGGDDAQDVAVDSGGNVYVMGNTNAVDFPTTAGVFQPAKSGISDIFVAKLNPTGSALVYSTHLGSSVSAKGIEVDAAGNAYVVGATRDSSFPTTAGAFQAAIAGDADVVVAKLNPTGSALLYSTYLGGSGGDSAADMDLDSAGNVYVTGLTFSSNYPTTPGAFDTTAAGRSDGFVTKINPTGSALTYSTYIGGTNDDELRGIAVDGSGNAYLGGASVGTDFPTTAGAYQTAKPSPESVQSAMVVKLNPGGSALTYATYLGGTRSASVEAIDIDTSGNAYVTGATHGPSDFPTTAAAFQTTKPNLPSGNGTGFVTKLNPVGSGLVYSTYLGGTNGTEIPTEIFVDAAGSAHVVGSANATTFPLVDPVQATFGGGFYDASVSTFSPSGSSLTFSTFLGGNDSDSPTGVVVDSAGSIYVAGNTRSTNFPIANALQPVLAPENPPGNRYDAFVAKIGNIAPNPFPGPRRIQNVASGLYAEVSNGSTAEGAFIVQNPQVADDRQVWTFEPTGGGHYVLRNVASNKVAAQTGSRSPTPITSVTYTGAASQHWRVESRDGSWKIINAASGRCTDVYVSTSGANIIVRLRCASVSSQVWNIPPA